MQLSMLGTYVDVKRTSHNPPRRRILAERPRVLKLARLRGSAFSARPVGGGQQNLAGGSRIFSHFQENLQPLTSFIASCNMELQQLILQVFLNLPPSR